MRIMVNDVCIANIMTNRSMTTAEAMCSLGYDITSAEDCKAGYERGIEGFYIDDCGNYLFDEEAAELIY